MSSLIQLKKAAPVFVVALVCFGVLPTLRAVSPPPDGGYPGGNTAEGQTALLNLSTGGFNTAVGYLSLRSNTTNSFNTAIGAGTLLANTADGNTAIGAGALLSNTTGDNNTATGLLALFFNTAGTNNTATGGGALESNITGNGDTATGVSALVNNATGLFNTADGFGALLNNTTGGGNTALGANAGSALTTGNNNIDIGVDVVGVAGDANTIRIGNPNITRTFIRGISGNIAAGGATVYVESDGHLGTIPSSARFKQNIKPMDKASEAILALRPVSFRYKKEIDPQGIPEFGLVAEEVEKVNPDLIIRDPEGRPYTVRYEQVNAMLLNEFLKEHRKVEEQNWKVQEQEATIAQLKKDFGATIAQLTARLDEQASQIQKVSAQVQLSKPEPQTVLNNH